MQEIDKLLDHVTISAASVCGNLKTIKTSFDKLKKEIEELKTCKENLLKELNKEATSKAIDLKNHQVREMTLVDELAEKNQEIERLNRYNKNLDKVNNDLVTRVTLLESEIESRKKAFNELMEEMANRYIAIETHDDICKEYEDKIGELEEENEKLKAETEWQKKKLQEFDRVLTKYRAKIKELEGHDEESRLAILAGAYAIHKHNYFDDGAYYNVAANGIIGWKHAEQVLMDMVTKE